MNRILELHLLPKGSCLKDERALTLPTCRDGKILWRSRKAGLSERLSLCRHKSPMSSSAKAGDPVRRGLSIHRHASKYWIARSSRAITAESGMGNPT